MTLTLNDKIQRSETIISSEIDTGMVMMDIQQGQYYNLNAIAGRIWELLETSKSGQDICETLVAEYEISPQICEKEVLSYLEKLHNMQIISRT